MQWQRNLTVSGISVLPLAGLEATSILTHPGPFIHFTKSEAATIAAVLCIILALSIATVLRSLTGSYEYSAYQPRFRACGASAFGWCGYCPGPGLLAPNVEPSQPCVLGDCERRASRSAQLRFCVAATSQN